MPRKLLAALLLVVLFGGYRAGGAAALDLVVVDQTVEADFPTGLTMSLTFRASDEVERAYVLYTLGPETVATEVAATLGSDDDGTASASIDMEYAFVPAGVDITYRWRLVTADAERLSDPSTITWLDDRFEWERTESSSVELFAYSGDDDLRADVLRAAQATVDEFGPELGVSVSGRLRIWMYASKEDFDGTLASNSQEWAAGASYPDLRLILVVIPKDQPAEIGRIIPHEISHQLLAMAAENPYNSPAAWLDEGVAVRNQSNGTSHMDRLVARAKRDGDLIPLAALVHDFPFARGEASLAYAQSFSAVDYVVDTYGATAVARILDAYAAGSTHDDALRAGTGRGIEQLDEEWRASIDDSVSQTLDRDAIARGLIYGLPGIGVVVYLVARRLRPPAPLHDELPA